jgi:hypothetical protein
MSSKRGGNVIRCDSILLGLPRPDFSSLSLVMIPYPSVVLKEMSYGLMLTMQKLSLWLFLLAKSCPAEGNEVGPNACKTLPPIPAGFN